ncbi:CD2 antigen cytoplasmic tail-binding protein 2-like [Tropilaelaps mercedesae]|uniref:CD2 antigen cytoplasmic tail-binding protein 2-like n=1 Tax=Tropilaelaps mercedesae TaxID=418985 RepID=A0A1V9XRD6_9ACAR|nr:CD2 antigen cytoplasmic tail-binding protein 2-like [Tropilaelaps mercedesae]
MRPGRGRHAEDQAGSSRRQSNHSYLSGDEDEHSCPFEAKKAKINSLDSDEEDEHEIEKEKYNVANAETDRMFDGQEKATIAFDGETKITAFNMEEEMQEGHFDKEGTFIFRKEKDELRDGWLDNIDWVEVKEREEAETKAFPDSPNSNSNDANDIDVKEIYSKMLEVIRPGENVLQCIKRLGGGQPSNKTNRKEKKKLNSNQQMVLDKIVGLANDILATGDMDIYQKTYEQLKFALAPKKDTACMDIFAEDDAPVEEVKASYGPSTSAERKDLSDVLKRQVMWEYKWDDADSSKVYGPYSSEDMLAWREQGYFGDGVYVRKVNEEKFYSSKRIDFDLYI